MKNTLTYEYVNEFGELMTLKMEPDGTLLFKHTDIGDKFMPLKDALKYVLNDGERKAIETFLKLSTLNLENTTH